MGRLHAIPRQAPGRIRAFDEARGAELYIVDYAGWMEHSFFALHASNTITGAPLHPSEATFSDVYSVGAASGSNPVSGSATWAGVMAGIDERPGDTMGDLVEGDATLTIDSFTQPTVDLDFTNITNQRTNALFPSLSWSSVPLSAGTFRGTGLVGHFYGPDHEEAGGIFNRDEVITGAFGAKRE